MTRLLPNLYKQYWVQNQKENARVISAASVLEERKVRDEERRRMEKLRQAELAKSFEAGIVRNNTEFIEEINEEVEETVDTETLIRQANEEAERIMEEAKNTAASVIREAEAEAEAIRKEAKEQGYKEGAFAKEQELLEKQNLLETDYSAKSIKLEYDYTQKFETMERDLVNVILEVFNRVFHIQFDDKKHILMHLIGDAILNIEGDRSFRIRVADSNVLFLENHREEMLERVGHGIELEFIADSAMEGNDCLIETDSGVFDCSLDMQLENLIKDIRSLCS